jgi:hypothetical protein
VPQQLIGQSEQARTTSWPEQIRGQWMFEGDALQSVLAPIRRESLIQNGQFILKVGALVEIAYPLVEGPRLYE